MLSKLNNYEKRAFGMGGAYAPEELCPVSWPDMASRQRTLPGSASATEVAEWTRWLVIASAQTRWNGEAQ